MGEFHDAVAALESLDQQRRGRPKRDPSDRLQGKIVWTAWILAEGGESSLRARYLLSRIGQEDALAMRSDEINLYRKGSRSLSRSRQALLVKAHPRLASVLGWPLRLLSPQGMTLRTLDASMRPFLVDGFPSPLYVFPGDEAGPRVANRRLISYLDLERLYERGDAYGFFAIAAAYRMFHLKRLHDSQWTAARYLIKALPGLCREAYVRPHAEDAVALTKALLVLLPDTSFRIEVDEEVLWQQIAGVDHQPCRQLRLAAADEGRTLEEPADPIVPYAYRRCKPGEVPLMLSGAG